MARDIKIIGVFGHERKFVRLLEAEGMGGGFQLYIENYYQGVIIKKNGSWVGQLNPQHDLTGDDIFILGDIIDSEDLE